MIEKNPVLAEVFRDGTVEHPNGRKLKVTANISRPNVEALGRFVSERKPRLVVEIGMAYGVSTLAILSALKTNGDGRLISIDPYIGWPTGHLVALHQVARAGLSSFHQHCHECSYESLPKLLAERLQPDLVYIDGNHNFDYVFTDFFFADKLIHAGGVIAFNDSGWRPVYKVIRFLRKFRRYRELDVALPRAYRSRNLFFSLIKRLEGRSSYDRYFQKLEDWEPEHGFHRAF
jgi:predicted O-methyltransferase YrrM